MSQELRTVLLLAQVLERVDRPSVLWSGPANGGILHEEENKQLPLTGTGTGMLSFDRPLLSMVQVIPTNQGA